MAKANPKITKENFTKFKSKLSGYEFSYPVGASYVLLQRKETKGYSTIKLSHSDFYNGNAEFMAKNGLSR